MWRNERGREREAQVSVQCWIFHCDPYLSLRIIQTQRCPNESQLSGRASEIFKALQH